ncbi:M23 family metallopeptidase [Thioclava sp. SK-1]|uniref:M23 family metallopeptidase n=1 Tax=Thioclava sp. SK-1 TaxID=1889770 RepID=UPI0009F34483|nr:M23 family metallopeptidase [Thioclava sp. SK-1]
MFGAQTGFAFPVECKLGETCYIQNYVDHDPSQNAIDFTCENLTYDGHDGTDIALATQANMQAGVTIHAAAPGIVQGRRDGEADGVFANGGAVTGVECGNGVVINHPGGWQTQYCHMLQGSVAVTSGMRVDTGSVLGQIGQSGKAAFPHLHFEIRHDGTSVDPFTAGRVNDTCGKMTDQTTLWQDEPPYQAGGILSAGFSAAAPDYTDLKAGIWPENPDKNAPALIIWTYGFGLRDQDQIQLTATGPNGFQFDHISTATKNQALFSRYAGKRLPNGAPAGAYQAQITVRRTDEIIDSTTVNLTIAP